MATLEPITRIEQFLNDIIEQGGGGGGSGGGSNIFLANATVTRGLNDFKPTITFDKTFAEMKAAYTAGQLMLCKVNTTIEGPGITLTGENNIAFIGHHDAEPDPDFPILEEFGFNVTFFNQYYLVMAEGYVMSDELTWGDTAVAHVSV